MPTEAEIIYTAGMLSKYGNADQIAEALRQACAEAIEECAVIADAHEDAAANMSFDSKLPDVGYRYAAIADECNAVAAEIRALAHPHKEE